MIRDGSGWPDAAKDAMREMWQGGASASEVAKAYTGKFDQRRLTRNAVIGLAHRNGWGGNGDIRCAPSVPGVKRWVPSKPVRVKSVKPVKPKLIGKPATIVLVDDLHRLPALPPPPPPAAPINARRTIYEPIVFEGSADVLIFDRGNGCGYITGETAAGSVYCGKAVDRSTRQKAYCADHHRVVYQVGSGMRKETQRRAVYHGR